MERSFYGQIVKRRIRNISRQVLCPLEGQPTTNLLHIRWEFFYFRVDLADFRSKVNAFVETASSVAPTEFHQKCHRVMDWCTTSDDETISSEQRKKLKIHCFTSYSNGDRQRLFAFSRVFWIHVQRTSCSRRASSYQHFVLPLNDVRSHTKQTILFISFVFILNFARTKATRINNKFQMAHMRFHFVVHLHFQFRLRCEKKFHFLFVDFIIFCECISQQVIFVRAKKAARDDWLPNKMSTRQLNWNWRAHFPFVKLDKLRCSSWLESFALLVRFEVVQSMLESLLHGARRFNFNKMLEISQPPHEKRKPRSKKKLSSEIHCRRRRMLRLNSTRFLLQPSIFFPSSRFAWPNLFFDAM